MGIPFRASRDTCLCRGGRTSSDRAGFAIHARRYSSAATVICLLHCGSQIIYPQILPDTEYIILLNIQVPLLQGYPNRNPDHSFIYYIFFMSNADLYCFLIPFAADPSYITLISVVFLINGQNAQRCSCILILLTLTFLLLRWVLLTAVI